MSVDQKGVKGVAIIIWNKSKGLCIGLLAWGVLTASAQEPASHEPKPPAVTLPLLLKQAAEGHPAIRGAKLDADAAEQDVKTAQLARWPTLSATLESRGSNAATTATRAVNVEQTLWDGGRTQSRIAESTALSSLSRFRLLAVRQELWLEVANAWQNYLAAQGRAAVATATLKRLAEYRAVMSRRVEAQASPAIELELVEARILQTQVEYSQADASKSIAVARLEQLTGLTRLAEQMPSEPAVPALTAPHQVADWLSAIDVPSVVEQTPSVIMAQFDGEAARHRLEAKSAEKYPQFYARVSQPLGSASPTTDRSTAFFVGLRYTPGAGLAQLSEAKSLAIRAQSAEEAAERARRDVMYALGTDRAELSAAASRLMAAQSSVTGSELVLSSYLRQFQGARKTWQDVLNAARELAQNQYGRIDTQASLVGALCRLQIRLGWSAETIGTLAKDAQ